MKEKKAFSLIEVIIVVALLGIFLMMATVSSEQSRKFSIKTKINTYHRIIINAIDDWTADNISAIQRPANFYSRNSQDKMVYEYITSNEIFIHTNLKKVGENLEINTQKPKNSIYIDFAKGVMITSYCNENGEIEEYKRFLVIKPKNKDSKEIEDYNFKANRNQIIEGKYKALKN